MSIDNAGYMKEIKRIEEELERRTCVKDISKIILFVNTDNRNISLSLNIDSVGDMKPLLARRFADCIKEAATLAENFKYNGYEIV